MTSVSDSQSFWSASCMITFYVIDSWYWMIHSVWLPDNHCTAPWDTSHFMWYNNPMRFMLSAMHIISKSLFGIVICCKPNQYSIHSTHHYLNSSSCCFWGNGWHKKALPLLLYWYRWHYGGNWRIMRFWCFPLFGSVAPWWRALFWFVNTSYICLFAG